MKINFTAARNAATAFLAACDTLDYSMADGVNLAGAAASAQGAEDGLRVVLGVPSAAPAPANSVEFGGIKTALTPAAVAHDGAAEVADKGMLCLSAPERIWLQVDPEPLEAGKPQYPTDAGRDDVTWCRDQINETDTLYIRADRAQRRTTPQPAPAAEHATTDGPAPAQDAAHGPMAEAPELGTPCWFFDLRGIGCRGWMGRGVDWPDLKCGRLFRTESAAHTALQAGKGGE